jgi:cation transport regulator ChaC
MKYFAYGPNMNGDELNRKEVQFSSRTAAKLKGYKLVFNKYSTKLEGEGKINLEKDTNGTVEGALYEIPTYEIKKLDVAYGYPLHYQHQKLKITAKTGEETDAVVFVATDDMVEMGLKPRKAYLKLMIDSNDVLSKEYLQFLKSIPTLD